MMMTNTSESSVITLVVSLCPANMCLHVNKRQLLTIATAKAPIYRPTNATAKAPIYRPTNEQTRECRLLCRLREQSRNLQLW